MTTQYVPLEAFRFSPRGIAEFVSQDDTTMTLEDQLQYEADLLEAIDGNTRGLRDTDYFECRAMAAQKLYDTSGRGNWEDAEWEELGVITS